MKKLMLLMVLSVFVNADSKEKSLILFPQQEIEKDEIYDALKEEEESLPPAPPQYRDKRRDAYKTDTRRYEGDPLPSDWFYNNPYLMGNTRWGQNIKVR